MLLERLSFKSTQEVVGGHKSPVAVVAFSPNGEQRGEGGGGLRGQRRVGGARVGFQRNQRI